jgi:ribosome recycling factor
MPLNQVASLSVPEPALIVAQPFDPSTMKEIEKAIRSSDLGLNPSNDGKVIRIPIPSLTDERRKELSRHVHKQAEEGRNVVRNVRRDAERAAEEAPQGAQDFRGRRAEGTRAGGAEDAPTST